MELMDEQEMIRKAYFDATQASSLPPQWIYEFALNLLAAHSAGAQEPVAYTSADRLKRITERNRHVDTMWPASMRDEGDIPLYTHPQPMPQTDAARDVLVRAKRMLEGYADSYKRMGQDSTSRGGDGRITCTAIMYDIRDNMAGWCDAEIERLDRAKGA